MCHSQLTFDFHEMIRVRRRLSAVPGLTKLSLWHPAPDIYTSIILLEVFVKYGYYWFQQSHFKLVHF